MVNSTIKNKNKGRKQSNKNISKGGMLNVVDRFEQMRNELKGDDIERGRVDLLCMLKEALHNNSTIYTTGYGQSEMAAQYLAGCLRCFGINSLYYTPEGFEHGEVLKVRESDQLICFGGSPIRSNSWEKMQQNEKISELQRKIIGDLIGKCFLISAVPDKIPNLIQFKDNNISITKDSRLLENHDNQILEDNYKLPIPSQEAFFTFIHALLNVLGEDIINPAADAAAAPE